MSMMPCNVSKEGMCETLRTCCGITGIRMVNSNSRNQYRCLCIINVAFSYIMKFPLRDISKIRVSEINSIND